MNIALFTDTFLPDINGVVTSVVNHINKISSEQDKFIIFTAGNENKNYSYNPNVHVIQYKGFTMPNYKGYSIVIPKTSKVIEILKEFNPDIIHIHTPFGIGLMGAKAGKKLNIPVIGTHHTFLSDYVKHVFFFDLKMFRKMNDIYTAWFFNKCNLVTSPSQALLNELKRTGVKKEVIKIPNGINISGFKKKKSLKKEYNIKKSVMYFGRVSYEKSVDILVKSMEIVQKKYSEVVFLVIGDGPELKEIKKLSKDLNVQAVFTGFKKGQELIDCIYMGDIFVTASKSENQPMSILEAMACGKAMVGVKARGVPELIINKKNGLIAEPDNCKDIAEKIEELLKNKSLKKKYEKESLNIIREYSMENIAKRWQEIYKNLSTKTKPHE